MEDLQKRIGYTFKNTDLLTEALTHSSYANEHKAKHIKYNERLEFLGDAVLSIVVSDYKETTAAQNDRQFFPMPLRL